MLAADRLVSSGVNVSAICARAILGAAEHADDELTPDQLRLRQVKDELETARKEYEDRNAAAEAYLADMGRLEAEKATLETAIGLHSRRRTLADAHQALRRLESVISESGESWTIWLRRDYDKAQCAADIAQVQAVDWMDDPHPDPPLWLDWVRAFDLEEVELDGE